MIRRNFAIFFVTLMSPSLTYAETIVTTYIVKKQTERRATRFTLDEWLRTKQRMRDMDEWLMLVSMPEKENFSPELGLEYHYRRGSLSGTQTTPQSSAYNAKLQLWLTNLISGTLGLRTLNVDLGGEIQHREIKASASLPTSSLSVANVGFRIFGKSTQDTTLVLKAGRYTSVSALTSADAQNTTRSGYSAGAGLQLYVTDYLGAEGNFSRLGSNTTLSNDAAYYANLYDYNAFLEFSLFRIQFGRYYESVHEGALYTKGEGYFAGVKVFL